MTVWQRDFAAPPDYKSSPKYLAFAATEIEGQLNSSVGLEDTPPMHRLASVHVENPMRSLNRRLVWLSAPTRHHRARAAAACPMTGDGGEGTACPGAVPMTWLGGAVMRIFGVELCARGSGMEARSSLQLMRDESALIALCDESALRTPWNESALCRHYLSRHGSIKYMELLGNICHGHPGHPEGRADAFAAARPQGGVARCPERRGGSMTRGRLPRTAATIGRLRARRIVRQSADRAPDVAIRPSSRRAEPRTAMTRARWPGTSHGVVVSDRGRKTPMGTDAA
jgi:hypothetical protein